MDTRSQPWSISALAQEITRTDLPTNMEVVRHSYHVINRLQTEDERFLRKVPDFADYKNLVLDDLFELWARANVPLNNRTTAETKLKKLCKDFRDRVKAAKRRKEESINDPFYKKLFDICRCKCNFQGDPPIRYGKVACSCPVEDRIPERGKSLAISSLALSIIPCMSVCCL